jgi:ADP-ribose pyrophosphatase YjhB (NUDIX family)
MSLNFWRRMTRGLSPAPFCVWTGLLFTYHEQCLKVLLVQRSSHPEMGKWGLPGGFVDMREDRTLEDTVLRKLREKTGVVPPYVDQLFTRGNAVRDKRGWSVTVCYTALIAYQDCAANTDPSPMCDGGCFGRDRNDLGL